MPIFAVIAESFEFLLSFLGVSAAAVTGFMADVTAISVAQVVRKLALTVYAISVFGALYLLMVAALQSAMSSIAALMVFPSTGMFAGFSAAMGFIAPRHGTSFLAFILAARVALMAFTWAKTRIKWLVANF